MMLAFSADLPIRLLAVVGAAALGAVALGAGTQLVVKLCFGQRLPRWPLLVIYLLGAVACGWLVSLWLFGGGGGGIGGPGGADLGSGGSPGQAAREPSSDKPPAKKDSKEEDSGGVLAETLTVEVLGDSALKKLAKGGTVDAARRYRVGGEPALISLGDLKKRILSRRGQAPPLGRLEVVLYLDSPDRQGAQVAPLVEWANDLEVKGKKWLRVDFAEKDRYAPVE